MPYKIDKPPDKIKDLPKGAQEVWIKAYNAAYKQYDKDEEKANKVAWSAVEKSGYSKNKQGKWVKEAKEKYNCECLKCHHKLTSEKHCRDIKCPECGGEMRRVERPGAGAPEKRKKEGIDVSKLQKFMESLIADAKSVWKASDSEQNKIDKINQALKNTFLFPRDSWVHTLFPDVAIVYDMEKTKYYAVEYSIKKNDVEFGDSKEVELAYIPVEEQKKTEKIEKKLNESKVNVSKNLKEIVDTVYVPMILERKGKDTFLKGIFMEREVKNENERVYSDYTTDRIIEALNTGKYSGFDGHPSMLAPKSPGKTSHRFTKAWAEDSGEWCKFKILDTTEGKDLKIVAQEGIPIGLSLRGVGEEKWDKERDAYLVDEKTYVFKGLDTVTEPAFEKAQAIIEQRQKSKEGGENMDELKEQIADLLEAVKNQSTEIKQLKDKKATLSEEDAKLLLELKAENEKNKNLLEAKQEVKKILEKDEYKNHEFKDTIRDQLEKCENVDMVNKTLPLILDTLAKFKGQSKEPEPTSVIISSGKGFFGADKHPNTMEEAYKWCLDSFEDTGIWQGKSRLDNPRYKASVMLENYLKLYMGGGSQESADSIPRSQLFKKSRRNPIYHILKETIGDDEMASTDVTALAGYLLPLYVTTMKDMMNIVNPAIGVLPIPKPTAVIPFKKTYYFVSSGTWAEINPANFTRTKAVSSEGGVPLKIKIKTLTNNITLKDPLKLQYEWTIEAQQDLMAYYGMNVDSDTLQEARNEIMRELSEQILYALLTAGSFANSDNCVQATNSPLTYNLVNPQGWSKEGWLKYGLTKAVKQADALINKQPHNVKADTIIVDAAYDYLFTEPQFVSEDKILTSFGFNRIGTYQAHYKVYTTTCTDYAGKIVLLHRGSRITEAPHLFMPYVLFWIGGVVEQATAEFSRTVMSRFATEKVYGQKIAVINIV